MKPKLAQSTGESADRCCGPVAAALAAPRGLTGRADWVERLTAATVGAATWTMLGLALSLHADPAGHGTHRQLGMPPCGFLAATGHPCPSCGMTTAFAAFVHGDLAVALHAHILGTLLGALALVTALGATLTVVGGVSFAPVLSRIFMWSRGWMWMLAILAAASWAINWFK